MKSREQVVEFIQKLQRRAKDGASSEAEVNMAIKTIANLMAQHQLEEADVILDASKEKSNFESMMKQTVWDSGQCVDKLKKNLAWVSVYLCSVRSYYQKYVDEKTGRQRERVVFYGFPQDVAVAIELQVQLWKTMKSMAKKRCGKGWNKPQWDYCRGFVDGLSNRALGMAAELRSTAIEAKAKKEIANLETTALVVAKKTEMLTRYGNEVLRLRTGRRSKATFINDRDTYLTGKRDAQSVNLSNVSKRLD